MKDADDSEDIVKSLIKHKHVWVMGKGPHTQMSEPWIQILAFRSDVRHFHESLKGQICGGVQPKCSIEVVPGNVLGKFVEVLLCTREYQEPLHEFFF